MRQALVAPLFAVAVAVASCAGRPVEPAPGDAGRGCAVTGVPAQTRATLQLADFYQKHLDAQGLPIVTSPKVPDEALCVAREVVLKMAEHRPELLQRLAERRIRLALMARTEVTTDIPEHADLTPKDVWDARARGLGATVHRPAVSAAEENVLCQADDRYRGESVLVHELAHTFFDLGVEPYEPERKARLDQAYADAIDAGRFVDTYAGTNPSEYWAEGAQGWFDANLSAQPPDGIHNHVRTRTALKGYDAALATLLAEVFGDRAWRYRCP